MDILDIEHDDSWIDKSINHAEEMFGKAEDIDIIDQLRANDGLRELHNRSVDKENTRIYELGDSR
jgi:hypothetical protein